MLVLQGALTCCAGCYYIPYGRESWRIIHQNSNARSAHANHQEAEVLGTVVAAAKPWYADPVRPEDQHVVYTSLFRFVRQ